jgi:hypothetical protein
LTDFTIKDSGERQQFDSGMVRDTTEGKTDYLLTRDGPMYERWAIHLTKGAQKYAPRNWMQANGEAELERFRESALRHFEAWLAGERDEDHAAAVFFNINGAEYVQDRMNAEFDAGPNEPGGYPELTVPDVAGRDILKTEAQVLAEDPVFARPLCEDCGAFGGCCRE